MTGGWEGHVKKYIRINEDSKCTVMLPFNECFLFLHLFSLLGVTIHCLAERRKKYKAEVPTDLGAGKNSLFLQSKHTSIFHYSLAVVTDDPLII